MQKLHLFENCVLLSFHRNRSIALDISAYHLTIVIMIPVSIHGTHILYVILGMKRDLTKSRGN